MQTRKRLDLCYVCTPYRNANELVIEQNILNARKAAVKVMQETDYFPVSPCLNTAGFHHYTTLCGKGDDFWLSGDIELLERCDAIYLAPGWEKSEGCRKEVIHALGMAIRNPFVILWDVNGVITKAALPDVDAIVSRVI